MFFYSVFLLNKRFTLNFGLLLSKIFFPGFIIFLIGGIGVGKTFIVKSFIGNFKKNNNFIKSPTYSLVESYYFMYTIHHFDF